MSSAANDPPAGSAARRRGVRLAVVVGVGCAVVALGITGSGLLLPGGDPTPAVRVIGAVVAIAAGGALVRSEGGARAVTTLATVSAAALGVCLVTLPVSPVTHPWTADAASPAPGEAPPAGDGGTDREVVIEDGGGDDGSRAPDAYVLPPGADVRVIDGAVVLVLPDGSRITIGGTAVGGGAQGAGPGGAVVVAGGAARTDRGEALGADVALGGATFERSDGSRATVTGGAVIEVPAPLGGDDPEPTDRLDAVLAFLLGCFALLAFAPPIARFGERVGVSLVDETRPEEPQPRPSASVEEGLADVLRSMLSDPDPRTAVIGAYARLLTALADAGFPRRSEEGPHEHLWRTLAPLGVRRQPVHQLAELFVRARFTPKPMTEEHRQAAIGALADAVADLRLEAADVDEVVASVGIPA